MTGIPPQVGHGWFNQFKVRARVEKVDGDTVFVIDPWGVRRQVNAQAMAAKGARPRVGEIWLIGRSTGNWAFEGVLEALPPTVSGSCAGNQALYNRCQALDDMGLIVSTVTLGTHPHPV